MDTVNNHIGVSRTVLQDRHVVYRSHRLIRVAWPPGWHHTARREDLTETRRANAARCRQILRDHQVTFRRTKSWKESNDPDRDAKLDRIEEVINAWPDRCFAFDEFGPLNIRSFGGNCWAPRSAPLRQPADYHKLHGVRQFHGCYSIGDDTVWGVVRRRESAANEFAALGSIRAARPDGQPIFVILDNAHIDVDRRTASPSGIRQRSAARRRACSSCTI